MCAARLKIAPRDAETSLTTLRSATYHRHGALQVRDHRPQRLPAARHGSPFCGSCTSFAVINSVEALLTSRSAQFRLHLRAAGRLQRSAVGDFRQVGGTYAGYRDLAGGGASRTATPSFSRCTSTARAPPSRRRRAAGARGGGGAARGSRGRARAARPARRPHQGAGRRAPDPVDPPSPGLAEGQVNGSVLRVCHYRAGGDGEAEAALALAAASSSRSTPTRRC